MPIRKHANGGDIYYVDFSRAMRAGEVISQPQVRVSRRPEFNAGSAAPWEDVSADFLDGSFTVVIGTVVDDVFTTNPSGSWVAYKLKPAAAGTQAPSTRPSQYAITVEVTGSVGGPYVADDELIVLGRGRA